MRAKETTFRELYAGDVIYVTPTFQRAYGHTENAVKRMVAAALAADAPPYFLGALVTRELGIRSGVRKALLIDGNQRLMTLLMLLLALRDTLAREAPDEADYLNRLAFLREGAGHAQDHCQGCQDRNQFTHFLSLLVFRITFRDFPAVFDTYIKRGLSVPGSL